MKKVHDIINVQIERSAVDPLRGQGATFPVAFIQYGNKDDGFQYELVCPWCAASIGWLQPADDTYGELARGCCTAMVEHYRSKTCTRFGEKRFDVERATESLNTEHFPKVQ